MDACGCEWECVCVLCLETGDIILHLKIKVVCHVKKKKKDFCRFIFLSTQSRERIGIVLCGRRPVLSAAEGTFEMFLCGLYRIGYCDFVRQSLKARSS